MECHGIIEITNIENRKPAESNETVFSALTESNTRFVHYPDCQQLIVWLPNHGMNYGMYCLKQNPDIIIEEEPVSSKLNGSIQLIWDTVSLSPGDYSLCIVHKTGGKHTIEFTKHIEGWEPVKLIVEEHAAADNPPIIYRDGLGNILENEDLKLRQAALEKIETTFSRRISYEGDFRSGYIIYTDKNREIKFYHEMGGGSCMFYVNIPLQEQWESETGVPVSERKAIVQYVAETVQAQQASNCYFEIKPDCIVYYYK